ncbi:MAG: hypothetical protein JWO86_1743 [Myxococcaceae bacterium]|nr:hypothetical protein [Myxococcaceae bacterium]
MRPRRPLELVRTLSLPCVSLVYGARVPPSVVAADEEPQTRPSSFGWGLCIDPAPRERRAPGLSRWCRGPPRRRGPVAYQSPRRRAARSALRARATRSAPCESVCGVVRARAYAEFSVPERTRRTSCRSYAECSVRERVRSAPCESVCGVLRARAYAECSSARAYAECSSARAYAECSMPERARHFADVEPSEADGGPSLGEEPSPRALSGIGLWRDGLASMHPAVEPGR